MKIDNRHSSSSRIRSVLSGLALIAVFAIAATMLVPPLFGYERYVVTGGSMTGAIDRGSVAFGERVPVGQLRVGDVITYEPPARSHVEGTVTHRIVRIVRDDSGRRVFRTKGDANPTPDPWRFTLDKAEQARVAFHVPHAGFVFIALQDRPARFLALGLPALLVALSVLASLWREAGTETRRERGRPEVAA